MKLHDEKILLLNQVKIQDIDKGSRELLKMSVTRLKEKHEMSYAQISLATGKPKSTLQNWVTGGQKNDNWQKTTRLVLKGLDIERLIQHFQSIIPSEEDKLKIQRLISALYGALKR